MQDKKYADANETGDSNLQAKVYIASLRKSHQVYCNASLLQCYDVTTDVGRIYSSSVARAYTRAFPRQSFLSDIIPHTWETMVCARNDIIKGTTKVEEISSKSRKGG